jgi:hypothetical protein
VRATGAALLVALAAAACKGDKPAGPKTVPLARAPEARGVVDAGVNAAAPPVAEEPDAGAGGEPELPPGKEWRTVPELGVDVAVAPEVTMRRGRGEVVLADDMSELHVKRGGAGVTATALKERLAKEGGGKLGVIVDRSEGPEFRLEYVLKDKKSGAPIFGLAMRRVVDGEPIDCSSRGFDTSSTKLAFDACRVMRPTPR